MSSAQLVFMSGTWSEYLSNVIVILLSMNIFKITWSEHKERPTMWKCLLELQWRWLLQRWQWKPPWWFSFNIHDKYCLMHYHHLWVSYNYVYLVILDLIRLTSWEISASRRAGAFFHQVQESQVGWMIRLQRVRKSTDTRSTLPKVSQCVRKIA